MLCGQLQPIQFVCDELIRVTVSRQNGRPGALAHAAKWRGEAQVLPLSARNPAIAVSLNRFSSTSACTRWRSIPVRAGEPGSNSCGQSKCWVYPRTRGGTMRARNPPSDHVGLSPHARGNLGQELQRFGKDRSIPARAGEPPHLNSLQVRNLAGSCSPFPANDLTCPNENCASFCPLCWAMIA